MGAAKVAVQFPMWTTAVRLASGLPPMMLLIRPSCRRGVRRSRRAPERCCHAHKPKGGTWTAATADSGGSVGTYPGVGVDSAGVVHISYYDASNQALKDAHRTSSGSWTAATIDTVSTGSIGHRTSLYVGSTGQHTSMAMDSAGGLHAAYHDVTFEDPRCAYLSNGTWRWIRATFAAYSSSMGSTTRRNPWADARPPALLAAACALLAAAPVRAGPVHAGPSDCADRPTGLRGRVRQLREQLVTWRCEDGKPRATRRPLRLVVLRRNGTPGRVTVFEYDDEDPPGVTRFACRFDRRGRLTRRVVREGNKVREQQRFRHGRRGLRGSRRALPGGMSESTTVTRDGQGRVIERRTDHGPGNVSSGVRYHYGKDGRLEHYTEYTGPHRTRHELRYDGAGRVTRTTVTDVRSKQLLEVETVRYHPGGAVARRETTSYNRGQVARREVETHDSAGRLTSSTTLDPSGEVQRRRVNAYDARGRLVLRTVSGPGKTIRRRHVVVRDASGDVTEERLTERGETGRLTCQRARDRRGNWVALSCADRDWPEGEDPLFLPLHRWGDVGLRAPRCNRKPGSDVDPATIEVVMRRRTIRYW